MQSILSFFRAHWPFKQATAPPDPPVCAVLDRLAEAIQSRAVDEHAFNSWLFTVSNKHAHIVSDADHAIINRRREALGELMRIKRWERTTKGLFAKRFWDIAEADVNRLLAPPPAAKP